METVGTAARVGSPHKTDAKKTLADFYNNKWTRRSIKTDDSEKRVSYLTKYTIEYTTATIDIIPMLLLCVW